MPTPARQSANRCTTMALSSLWPWPRAAGSSPLGHRIIRRASGMPIPANRLVNQCGTLTRSPPSPSIRTGTLVATGAAWKDKTARLWDARTGQPVGDPMQHGADVFALAFDPKGELLATGSGDNTARLWNAHTGQPVGALMKHGGPVWALAFDRRGRFLATGSVDNTARLWKAHTGEPVGEPMQHGGQVWAVAFDPKGKLLATGSSGQCRPALARPFGRDTFRTGTRDPGT